MGSFNSTIITAKGHALMAKVASGASMQFTRIRTSDYQYPVGTNFEGLTSLSSVKQTTLVSSVSRINDVAVKVSGAFTNAELSTGYYLRVIGLYANDPDEGEILYSITTANQADWIPPNNGISASSILIDLITIVSNATNVTIDVDPNAVATVTDLNMVKAEISDIKGFIGYTDDDIVGVEADFKNKKFTRLAGAVNKNPGADFDSIKAFGGRKRCIVTDDGKVLAYYGEPGYSETGKTTVEIKKNSVTYPVGTIVQVMVEQPKFYYKVVPLELEKIPDYVEVNTLTVTAGATADGNLTITLDGVAFTVSVFATDNTPELVAAKIRNATYTGWTTGGTGAKVTFTCNTPGTKTTATFNGGSTGVTATVEKTVAGSISIGYHMRKARYYVSDTYKPGFKVHPAFIRNGVVKDKIYLSAYEGSIYDVSAAAYLLADEQVADFTVSTGDKLSSIAYAKPASGLTQNLTRANTRKLANNRGAGWQLSDVLSASVTQMLFIIEYASFNTQDKIGLGIVNKTDDGSTNMSELTGATTNLGNASGIAAGTNGLTSVSYRGEENPWGNIWKWMDGLNIEAKGIHQAYWADSGFADDIKTSPYKNCGFTLAKANGYVSAFGYSEDCDFLFLPSEVIGGSNLPVGDYFYQNHNYNGFLVALLGGSWNSGSNAGAFYWYVNVTSSSRSRAIGGRLLYVPQ
jgi:hypothetical protein